MASRPRGQRDWYSVSVDSVRIGIGLVLFAVAGIGGFTGYQRWEQQAVERSAFEVVAKSQSLIKQLKTEEELESYRGEYERAAQLLQQAERELRDEGFREANNLGEESLRTLQAILDKIRHRGQAGIAWFVSVEGDVQYRRGEKGDFVTARARDELYAGDYVRSSSNGSAEIYFSYGDVRFTIGPGALYQLPRTRSAGGDSKSFGFMEYGWVSMNTAQSSSGIATKYSEVTVGENTHATVSLPRESSESRVVVNRGRAAVKSARTGETRELGDLEQVTQSGTRLGAVSTLPEAPLLAEPPDNFSINIDATQEVRLVWSEIDGAVRYALQVSRSRLFNDNIIDVDGRRGAFATIGLQEEGSYLWRVAAIAAGGEVGPWSAARKFRVASFRGLSLEEDRVPPELNVEVIHNGNIVILRGETEPGASLELNGETITVNADGSFSTSKVLAGRDEEWVPLVLQARDEAGNTTVARRRVFLTSL